MKSQVDAVLAEARQSIPLAQGLEAVEALRVKYLGKKGALAAVLGGMGKLSAEERRALGEVANAAKAEIEALMVQAQQAAADAALEVDLRREKIDVSLPGRALPLGKRHPVSRALDDIVSIFRNMGFGVAQGPEIETDWHNFEALNVGKDHPARDMQDTFYVEEAGFRTGLGPLVLRTHTSPVQIRTMLKEAPPLRKIMPGRVYRRDSDVTHTPMFHQVEGLCVDEAVSFAELKGTLDAFAKSFFGSAVRTRFRPSFFPFTEPSAEVDVSCHACSGKGCRLCKQTGWLEVLGAGMVHPKVFASVGYPVGKVSGFAFGMGVERMTMLRHGIDDLRTLFENDHRFLAQF